MSLLDGLDLRLMSGVRLEGNMGYQGIDGSSWVNFLQWGDAVWRRPVLDR